jgi:uncharacterized phage protein gp47/JayE
VSVLQPITASQALQDMVAFVQANSSISAFSPGDPQRAILEAVALKIEQLSLANTQGLLQIASQGSMDAFGFAPLPATYATGTLTFSGSGGTVVPAGTQVSTVPAPNVPTILYATTAAVTLPTGSGTQQASVAAAALQAGAGQNVQAGTLTVLVSQVAGITAVTNAAAIDNGQDAQTTAQQQAAFGAAVLALQQASGPALVKAAIGVSGIAQAAVVENPATVNLTITSGGAVTDNSDEANLPWGAPYPAFAASPTVGDAFVIGADTIFTSAWIRLDVNGSGLTGSWQYWNGAWTALTATDGTSGLSQSGSLSFTAPSDWVQTILGGYQGYFVRFVLSSASYTTMATVYHIFLRDPPPGVVDLVVANGANVLTTETLDLVSAAAEGVRLPGITVNVVAATLHTLAVTASVTSAPGYATATVSTQVIAAITGYLQGLPIGAAAYISALTAAVFTVAGVVAVTFSAPTADTLVPATTLIVPGTIQATVTQQT